MNITPMKIELSEEEKNTLTAAYVLLDVIYNITKYDTRSRWATLTCNAADALNEVLVYIDKLKDE